MGGGIYLGTILGGIRMTKLRGIYKCRECGSALEVVEVGGCEPMCCGKPMELLEEKTADTSKEKHVPYIERQSDGYLVRVGQTVLHPMEEKHYIEWIELIVDGVVNRKYLRPGDRPEAVFKVPEGKEVSARELCNIHDLWANKL